MHLFVYIKCVLLVKVYPNNRVELLTIATVEDFQSLWE